MKEILPSEILCVHDKYGKRAALVLRWGAWLPCELNPLYAEAIDALRSQGRKVAQATDFQGDGGLGTVRALFRKVLDSAMEHSAQDIVTIVAPRVARSYRALCFEDMLPADHSRVWDLARDPDGDFLPTRLIRLAIDQIPPEKMGRFF